MIEVGGNVDHGHGGAVNVAAGGCQRKHKIDNVIYSCLTNVTGNYIGETSNRLRFRLNNPKKSIRDNSRGFPVAVHFNQPDHSFKI